MKVGLAHGWQGVREAADKEVVFVEGGEEERRAETENWRQLALRSFA